MGNTTADMSASLMKQVWLEKFLQELRSKLVFKDLGEMGKAPGANGEIIHWLSMADMSVHTTAATEGTDPTEYVLSGGDKTAYLIPYNDSVKISRHLAKTWLTGSMTEVMSKLSRHAAAKMDRVIRDTNLTAGGMAAYTDGATTRATVAQSSTFAADVADFRGARNKLERLDVEPHSDGFYVAAAHPDVQNTMHPLSVMIVIKFLKLRGHLIEAIRSEIQKWRRSETIIGTPIIIG